MSYWATCSTTLASGRARVRAWMYSAKAPCCASRWMTMALALSARRFERGVQLDERRPGSVVRTLAENGGSKSRWSPDSAIPASSEQP